MYYLFDGVKYTVNALLNEFQRDFSKLDELYDYIMKIHGAKHGISLRCQMPKPYLMSRSRQTFTFKPGEVKTVTNKKDGKTISTQYSGTKES